MKESTIDKIIEEYFTIEIEGKGLKIYVKGDLALAHRSYFRVLSFKPKDPIILMTLRQLDKKKFEFIKSKHQKRMVN